MIPNSQIARGVRRALALSAIAVTAFGPPALAQDQVTEIATVVVTGSRIVQPNLTSISPVAAVSSTEIKLQGVTRTEDLINNLPQAFADFGGNLANGATGAATVNLRNLGSERTLVLVNGRRLMPGDPTQNGSASPDLNQIPAALVERVEVLTGGASAVYGADAVAGVVNFIMNTDFEGIRFDSQYSFYQHNNDNDAIANLVRARNFDLPEGNVRDGYTRDFTFIAGVNTEDGRGNATVYVGYRELDALKQSERDFSACSLGSSPSTNLSGPFSCSGSGTTAPARFLTATGDFTIGQDGQLRNFNGATDAFNFAPANYYQRPDERRTGGLFAHYDLSEDTTVYTEFMFMDDRTVAQIAASGAFLGSGNNQPPFLGRYLVNCDNPFLASSMVQAFCGGSTAAGDVLLDIGRRNVEGGDRRDDLRHTSYRAVLGFRGNISDSWSYDVYGQFGTTVFAENFQNDMSLTRLGRALTAVRGADGNIVCRVNADADLSNDDSACVPYNIFQLDGVTPEALNYLQVPGFQEGSTTEQVLSGAITGDLGQHGIRTPWAHTGLGVAFGAEYRSEESDLQTDLAFQTNDLLGQGAAALPTFGTFNVSEVFAEARLPIAQDRPFARSLSVEAGYRYSDYSLGFDTDTYKLGADWAPTDDIRFRASLQRAVRAPNIQDLFLQSRVQLDGTSDPCASPTLGSLPSASFEECARTGVTAAQYGNILENPAGQYNGLVGGSPDLDPETSDTLSFGLVFTPTFLDDFSLALDYYAIEVKDIIGSLGADLILNNCLSSGDPTFCSLVNRSPGNGSLWLGQAGFVIDPFVNSGSLQTSGIDLEANYRLALGDRAGSLSLNLIGTYTDTYETEPLPGDSIFDCVGLYGNVCRIPIPEWRHKVRATWTTPWDLDLSLSWRYIDAVNVDTTSSHPSLAGAVRESDRTLDARNYFDLVGSYTFGGEVAQVTARLGINNLFDRDPPLVGSASCIGVFCSGNTFPQIYDTLGRNVFIGLTADF